jgi:hypothetical protein
MRNYGWPAIFARDGTVLLFAAAFTFLATDNTRDSGFYVPLQPPCSNAGWHEVLSFFLVLSLSIALLEGLNWVGWLVKRNRVLRSDPIVSQTEIDPIYGIDMLLPRGWIGLALGLGLLLTAYGLHGPSPCVPAAYSTTPGRYIAGALALAYGLLLLTQTCFDLAWKFTSARSK